MDRVLRRCPPAQLIELEPHRSTGGGPHRLERMAGDGGEDIDGARLARGAGGGHLARRMHQPAVAHRSEQRRKGQLGAQDARAQVDVGQRYRVARTERDRPEGRGVGQEGHLVFRPPVQIVEHHPRQPAQSEPA